MLRLNEGRTSKLNSAILHHQTDYECPEMSDCPFTGKTLLEKRELVKVKLSIQLWEEKVSGAQIL